MRKTLAVITRRGTTNSDAGVIHAPGSMPGVYAAKLRFQPSRASRNPLPTSGMRAHGHPLPRPPDIHTQRAHTRAHACARTHLPTSRVPFSSLFGRRRLRAIRCSLLRRDSAASADLAIRRVVPRGTPVLTRLRVINPRSLINSLVSVVTTTRFNHVWSSPARH